MTFNKNKWPLLILPLATAIGIAGIANASGDSIGNGLETELPDPYRCEIASIQTGAMISLESRVFAEDALEGRYTLSVKSAGPAGSADIRQGGAFTAAPGEMVRLGSVVIGSNGAGYTATLLIDAPGHVFDCEEQIGGRA